MAAAAAGAHDLEEVLEVAAEEARAAIGAASLSVSRWEREQGALRTIINVGELGPEEERYPATEVYLLHEDGNHGCANVPYKTRPVAADWLRERLG